jgi:hypothetical protein
MTVTVAPATFTFVSFDAAEIRRIAAELLASLGMQDREVAVEVDETTPLARIRIDLGDALTIHAESGALEDTRRPRELSHTNTATSLGRVLLRARDRLSGAFADAPADDELSLAQVAAWEAYCVGRLDRLGVRTNQQRWRYNFRNRHGFTDRADEAFDRLWSAEGLTWAELASISSDAASAPTA